MGKKILSIGKYKFCYDTLGKGSFARVELVTHEVTKCQVAMKIIDTKKITEDHVRNNLYREARILSQMNHPNIIRFYESLRADTFYCLVTECAQGGELSDYMRTFDDKRFPEDVARHYMRQLVSAMLYMHERGVVHRDLKMENLLLDKSKHHLKLVDFGLSNNLPRSELLSTHCGSTEYAAPELFVANARYGTEVDVWSFGIVLYTCVTGQLPFFSPYYDHARHHRLTTIITTGLTQIHERQMAHLTKECKSLIKEVLEPLPQIRLPLEEVITHSWITDQSRLSFTAYFPRSKLTEIKSQIVEKLAEMTNSKKIEVERFVHESATNELSAMFKMLLEDAKVEKGYYDEDHTNRPVAIIQERKRHMARMKWRKLRCRLKESARVFKEIIDNKQSPDALEKIDPTDAIDEALIKKNEARLKRVRESQIKKKINPVGFEKTEKKKEFFPPKRNLLQQITTMEENKSMSQLLLTRSKSYKTDSCQARNSIVTSTNKKSKRIRNISQNKSIPNSSSLTNSSKDVTKSTSVTDFDKMSQDNLALSRQNEKSTYRTNSKKNILPVAPFANIDEVDNNLLETASDLDVYEPRYCLIQVADGNVMSGAMLSSTVSEISNSQSFDLSSIDNDIADLQNSLCDDSNLLSAHTDTATVCSPRLSRDSQYFCNGGIPVNELTEDL